MTTLQDELDRLQAYYESLPQWFSTVFGNEEQCRSENYDKYWDTNLPKETFGKARLRLDYEDDITLPNDGEYLELPDDFFKKMFDFMKLDLVDLLENGDENQTHDALLKAMNGAKVRGKQLKDVDICSSHLCLQLQPRRKTVEATMYCLLVAEYE